MRSAAVALKYITLAPPTRPRRPTAVQVPIHIFFSVIDSRCWVALNFPHTSKVSPPEDTTMPTAVRTVRMNMNDSDKIWRRSESLIKDRQPVTYGNVSQWISGCPGFGSLVLLLCRWWLSVPDLSSWSPSSSHKRTRVFHPHSLAYSQNISVLMLTFSICSPLI